ncbi:MAG: MATE family efflux transporter [Thermoprotei archaeon]
MWFQRLFDPGLMKRVFRISAPMIVTELAHSIYSITDTYFVSGLGREALAGVGLAGYLFWLFMVPLVMFNGGLSVFVAQAYGAREYDKARRGAGEVLVYELVASMGLALFGVYMGYAILGIMSNWEEGVLSNAYEYFKWRVIGIVLAGVVWGFDTVLVATGHTRESMIANIAGVSANIVLDPILIYGYFGLPAMGVAGAALATIFSNAITGVINYYWLGVINMRPHLSLNRVYLPRILELGLPMAGERAVFSFGNNIYISIIARCGETALAAHTIGIRIESLIYMPGFAFMVAASTLVGQGVGAGDYEYAKRIGREAIKLGTILMAVLGVLVALLARYIAKPFSPSEDVLELATLYLILAGLSEPGLALAMTSGGGIRGAGNPRIPLIVNVAGLYTVRVIPSLILVNYLGVLGPWLAMFIDVYVRGITLYVIYEKWFTKFVRRVV